MPESYTYAPEGSHYEKRNPKRLSRRRLRRFKQILSMALMTGACKLGPILYRLYMRLVWSTSTVANDQSALQPFRDRRSGCLVAMWHQDTFLAPYMFEPLHVHTLASTGTSGRFITAILEAHNFKVFRGGSSGGKGRRRPLVLRNMMGYIQTHPDTIFGITVDGSKGPARVMKQGIAKLARDCGTPVFLVRTQAKRALHLPSWDRTTIPLPFNRITSQIVGPFWITPDSDGEDFKNACQHLQDALGELTSQIDRNLGLTPCQKADHCPKGATAASSVERAPQLSPWDLQGETMPPWAQSPAPAIIPEPEIPKKQTFSRVRQSVTNKRSFFLLLLFALAPLAMDAARF